MAILNLDFFNLLFLAWGVFEGILEEVFFGQIWDYLKVGLRYEINSTLFHIFQLTYTIC